MALETEVHRTVRYTGAGCHHNLLLCVIRPSYAGHDGGAEDAAYDLQESAMHRLRTWFERWILPRECAAAHDGVEAPDDESGAADEHGPGLRWIVVDGRRTYLMSDTARGGDLRDS